MTKIIARWTVAAVALASVLPTMVCSNPAQAQADGQAEPRGARQRERRQAGRALALAAVPIGVLETELALTAEQKTKIAAIQDRVRTETRQAIGGPGATPGGPGATPGAPGERIQQMRAVNEKARTEIDGVLTADQKARVPALLRELAPLRAAGIPLQVYPDLKLTDDQKKKIADVVEAARGKLRDATRGGDRAQATGIRAETRSQVQAVLTDDQKALVTKYEKEHPRRGRGRGGA